MAGNKKGKGKGKGNAKPAAENHAISAKEKRQIKNQVADFVNDPSKKDKHFATLDKLKLPAARNYFEELMRSDDYTGGPKDSARVGTAGASGPATTTAGQDQASQEQEEDEDQEDENQGDEDQEGEDQGEDQEPLDEQQIHDADTEPPSTGQDVSDSTNVNSAIDQDSSSTVPQADAVADVKHEATIKDLMAKKSAPVATDLKLEPVKFEVKPEMNNLLNTLKTSGVDLQYPVRESFGPKPRQVITNHFHMRVNPDYTLHQYKITPAMSGKSKRKIRLAIETVIEKCDFLNKHTTEFATDYFDTIVAWTKLHKHLPTSNHKLLSGDGEDAPSTWNLITLQDGPATLSFQLKYEGVVDVSSLIRHTTLDPAEANTDLQPVLRALNILVSSSFDHNPAALQMGANKFMLKTSYLPLSNGKEIGNGRNESKSLCTLRGYSYTVKPGAGTILLNVNAATSAFWNPVKVSEVIQDGFTFKGDYDQALRGVRVYILYNRGDPKDAETFKCLNSDHARIKPIEGLGKKIRLQEFTKDDGTSVTVRDYFEQTYSETISNPEQRAVNLGTRKEPRWYPAEYLRIMPYQKYKGLVPDSVTAGMLEVACQKPPEAKALVGLECVDALIGKAREETKLTACPAIILNPALLSVPSNRLPFPQIRYAGGVAIESAAVWDIRNRSLLQRPNKTFNVIAISIKDLESTVSAVFDNLKNYAGPPKGNISNYSVATLASLEWAPCDTASYDDMKENLMKLQTQTENANLALLVLPDNNPTAYALFKNIADRELGIHSLCVTRRCIQGQLGKKISNIVLKLNLKAAGVNHTTNQGAIFRTMADTLVLGADVTHPGNGAIPGTPSIATIVGSVGSSGGRFLGSMRLQNQAKKEIIDHVRPMVKERIIDWVKDTDVKDGFRPLPKNIIYYRDGVSDAQFLEVKNDELPQIERAFSDAMDELEKAGLINLPTKRPTVNITALVCIKRHSVRFYPVKAEDTDVNGNCKPGTHVQSVVTSPYFNDFYLQSHAAIKGTAKPAHYFVLRKDQDISIDDLRKLTHELCYTYVRAACGVSYASPAYYADRLCERGRQYLRDMYQHTPNNGVNFRYEFNQLKYDEEDKLEQIRINKFGRLRNADHTLRKRGNKEIEMEKDHREQVMAKCDEWSMNKAKTIFYGGPEAEGKNPWNANISNTMFWM